MIKQSPLKDARSLIVLHSLVPKTAEYQDNGPQQQSQAAGYDDGNVGEPDCEGRVRCPVLALRDANGRASVSVIDRYKAMAAIQFLERIFIFSCK